jgi:hypothetical protein
LDLEVAFVETIGADRPRHADQLEPGRIALQPHPAPERVGTGTEPLRERPAHHGHGARTGTVAAIEFTAGHHVDGHQLEPAGADERPLHDRIAVDRGEVLALGDYPAAPPRRRVRQRQIHRQTRTLNARHTAQILQHRVMERPDLIQRVQEPRQVGPGGQHVRGIEARTLRGERAERAQ